MKGLHSFLLGIAIWACGCSSRDRDSTIYIATAANMQFAMNELVESFSEKTGAKCEVIVGSSGKLTAQIKEGAPYDIFVSADMRFPAELYNSGLTEGPPIVYAYGKLVLFTADKQLRPALSLLGSDTVQHIAIANPRTAPYGRAAKQALERSALWDAVNDKLVYGESISQTNQFIISGAAEVGFSSLSVVMTPSMMERCNWMVIESTLYDPIEQGIVELRGRNDPKVREFLDFIRSDRARVILENYGYSIVPGTAAE